VNREAQTVEVFRDPSPGGYRIAERHPRGEDVAPAAFADLTIAVDDILG
jgi:Uma2 family endonuclease